MERIARQLEIQSPVAEKLITRIYSEVMNRHIELVDIGDPSSDQLHEDYLAYVKSRELLF